MNHKKVLIIGAGYTGLAAAVELSKNNIEYKIIEASDEVGGLSRTINFNGLKFELGPHIYFDKDEDINRFWKEFAGDKFKSYNRNNRIFYNGKFIKSPLNPLDAFIKLGPLKIFCLLSCYAKAKIIYRNRKIHSAEDWVICNFGEGLYNTFFKVYNEKIWGIPCSEISADWSGQRIKSSLFTMIKKSIKRDKEFIVKTFNFPDGGSETIYNAQINYLNQKGNKIFFNTQIKDLSISEEGFVAKLDNNHNEIFTHVISTIPLEDLIEILNAPINLEIIRSALSHLKYRNLILVNLVFEKKSVSNFKEHWIDIHDPNVLALRVTNFGNYNFGLSSENLTGVGLEYNCFEHDSIWKLSDKDLYNLALKDLNYMKLIDKPPINFQVLRLPKAYPIYFKGYQEYTNAIFNELKKISNLQLAGRNAMYKWNNMHHSVKTGILAAKNILGENHDLFKVKSLVSIMDN